MLEDVQIENCMQKGQDLKGKAGTRISARRR